MDGVLIVDKPADFTSFDVVAKLRHILHQKKIGHGGTLDPKATGVLPVFLGNATKLCDALPDGQKVYEAEILLGRTTDTEDIWGQTLTENEVSVSEEDFLRVLHSFEGTYLQVPPMYSAKKIAGKKLYELAREGKTVPREPVSVEIRRIEVLTVSLPTALFRVSCSKGTYIRSLCRDIGEALGCGACMSGLRRLSHGNFELSQAHSLREIEEAAEAGIADRLVLPVPAVLPYRRLAVAARSDRLLHNGNRIPLSSECFDEFLPDIADGERLLLFDSADCFCGVYRADAAGNLMIPEKMFLQ